MVEDVLLHKRASRSFLLDLESMHAFCLRPQSSYWPKHGVTRPWVELPAISSSLGIVGGKDRERFDAIIQSTMRLLNSTLAEVLTFILAYALAVGVRIAWQIPVRALSAAAVCRLG